MTSRAKVNRTKPRRTAPFYRVLLAAIVLAAPRPARAERTDVVAALWSYLYLVPLSLVVPSVYGGDVSLGEARSGPRFVLGWAWQIPLQRGIAFNEVRHRLPIEVDLGFGDNADDRGDMHVVGVDGRVGYRYVFAGDLKERGFSGLVGAGGSIEAFPRVTGGIYPEIGVRLRPHALYPLVLALIARCDVRFAGADLVRPSLVLSISVY